jgi:hypothetical protein
MNLNEAYVNATTKIASPEDALTVAIEMLEAIKDGKSYDAIEYTSLVLRMKEFAPVDLVAAVRSHAIANYNQDGWDFVVECYSDEELRKTIGGAKSVTSAITAVRREVKLKNSYRREIQSEVF